jgi:hypothetical protein
MTPMKPEDVNRILQQRPHLTRELIHEYQTLVARRFDVNPRLPKTAEQEALHAQHEERRKQLHDMIFG